jgi:hypothetical protein
MKPYYQTEPLQLPRLDPGRDEIAEPRPDPRRCSRGCSALLHVDDGADRSPANLERSVQFIKSNFGPDEKVHDGRRFPVGRRLVNARSAPPP